MIKEIERKYNDILSLTDKMPKNIEMSKESYTKLVEECMDMKVTDFTEILDKDGNPLNPFMGMKIKFNENVDKFKIML